MAFGPGEQDEAPAEQIQRGQRLTTPFEKEVRCARAGTGAGFARIFMQRPIVVSFRQDGG